MALTKFFSNLVVDGAAGTVLDVQGSVGQLFSVTDSLTGDLFAVSDISGIPILNVNSSGAVDIDGTLNLGDNNKIQLGASQDLQIYHDGSNSYISEVGSGDLIISADNDLTFKDGSGNIMANMNASNSVELMYGNVKKFETTSTGVTVTGNVGMATGHSSGKFAVMSTSVHASYDFYNNGSTYLNGATTIDAAFTQTGNAASTFSGTIAASNLSGTNTGDQTLPTLSSLGALSTSGGALTGNLTIGAADSPRSLTVDGDVNLDVMPGHESEGSIKIGRHDSNTSRYHKIRSYVSSTEASNYLKFSLHGGTENAVNDILILKGDGAVTTAGKLYIGTTAATSTATTALLLGAAGEVKKRGLGSNAFSSTSFAPLASPALTGTPTAPTAGATINTTQLATTAFVQTAIANLADSAPDTLNTLNELAAALGDDASFSTTVTNSIATKLPLAGGTLTGNIIHGDSVKSVYGAGNDLQIFHNGSNSHIETSSTSAGDFYVTARGTNHDLYLEAADNIYLRPQGNENGIVVEGNAGVTLYYNNGAKLDTTSTGVSISGGLSVSADTVLGNGLSDTAVVHGHLGIGEDAYPKIAYPGKNAQWSGSGSTTGQVVIDLPGTLSSHDMMYMEIDIYNYSAEGATKLIIGGHNWNSGANGNTSSLMWYNVNVQVIGALNKPIYFGRRNDGTSERRCIAIGETNSGWSYATVHVSKVSGASSFYTSGIDWIGDWNINQTTEDEYFTKNPSTNFNSGTTLETNGNISASNFSGSSSGTNTGDQTLPTLSSLGALSTTGKAADSNLLDGIDSSAFLRSNEADSFSGILTGTANGENLKIGGIRGTAKGSQTGEYIHLYERVHIGGPSGWGNAQHTAPSQGLGIHGGLNVGQNGSGVISMDDTTIVTAARALTNVTNTNWDTAYGWGDHGLSAQDKTDIGNLSGTNTGDQSIASIKTGIGTGNGKLVPAAGTSGHFLKHDGTFGIPAYTTNTNTQLSDSYVRGLFSGGTNVTLASDGTISSVNTTYSTSDFDAAGSAQDVQDNLDTIAGNVAGISNQSNTDVDTGTETIAQVSKGTYTAAFFDFVIKNGTNVRAGTVYSCHDGTNVEFTETSTVDLGNTSDVTLAVDISGTEMRLRATTTSDNWSVKSLVRAI